MKLFRANDGATVVEFALILPLFLLLMGGIIEFGRYVYVGTTLKSAAMQAVRMAVVRSDASGNSVTKSEIVTYAQGKAFGVDTQSCPPEVTYTAGNLPGSTVAVRFNCPFAFAIPGLNLLNIFVTQQASMNIST